MRTLALLVCVVAVLAVAGCVDGAGSFASSTAAHFTPGVTTRAQAIAALGPPSSVYEAANGEKTLSWARDGGLFGGDDTHQYAVVFGPDDKMVRVASAP